MTKEIVQIKQDFGLNAGLSALVVLAAKIFKSNILLVKNQKECNAKSIIAVVMIKAVQEDSIMVRADGVDEEAAVNTIVSILQIKKIEQRESARSGAQPWRCPSALWPVSGPASDELDATKVHTIWMREHESKSTKFITMFPQKK